jgi:hypothetical protein
VRGKCERPAICTFRSPPTGVFAGSLAGRAGRRFRWFGLAGLGGHCFIGRIVLAANKATMSVTAAAVGTPLTGKHVNVAMMTSGGKTVVNRRRPTIAGCLVVETMSKADGCRFHAAGGG